MIGCIRTNAAKKATYRSVSRRVLLRSIPLLTNVVMVMNQSSMLVVRSMSLSQALRRPHVVKHSLLHGASQTSNIMMMQLPFRRLIATNAVDVTVSVTNHQLLTRTMVYRMRISDLKDELERRGLVASGIEKLKRPDLVNMLLAEIPVSKTSADAPITNDAVNGTESTKDDETSTKVGRWSAKAYPIEQLQIDPNTTYAIAAIGATIYGKAGSGVGLVMRECTNNTIVWQAQKYYPTYRSVFESDYSAIILALRFVLQSFHLRNVQIHVSNLVLVNQIMGHLPVTKPTLQLLLGQVSQLLNENDANAPVFQLAERENRVSATALAQDALATKKSYNLDEENDIHRTVDPMIDILGLDKRDLDTKMPIRLVNNESDHNYVMKFHQFVNANEAVIDSALTYTLRFDGGSRGNPGIAGAGMVLYDDRDREIWRGVKYLGRNMSNNLAEYSALNLGLSHALSMGIERIRCEGDSQLVVKQLNGLYKVKSDNLRDLFHETETLMKKFKSCEVHHIRRELNSRADELANQAMATKKDYGFDQQLAG